MSKNESTDTNTRTARFRALVVEFIDTRRETKLKGKKPQPSLVAKYEYDTWLASAAERARHLQSVTHVLKGTHPSAKGSNAYVVPTDIPTRLEIGTHSLDDAWHEDTAVTDAKHLDVFSFLKQPIEGKRLLDWIREDDPDALAALHGDAGTARRWSDAFKQLIRPADTPRSHSLAKQIYWLVGSEPADDNGFLILQPLFPSSLVQKVHEEIQSALYGEENKDAFVARRNKKAYDGVFKSYPDIAVRKLGGANKQNVSQGNSERGGTNYLLSSLPPPRLPEREIGNILGIESALKRFAFFRETPALIRQLIGLLHESGAATFEIRKERESLEQRIGFQMPLFAATVRDHQPPGWTRNDDCQLALCEQLWLDPDRIGLPSRPHGEGGEDDELFKQSYHWGDWPDELAGRFANWFNEQLRAAGITAVADVEYRHWAKQVIVDAAWPVPMQRRAPERAK